MSKTPSEVGINVGRIKTHPGITIWINDETVIVVDKNVVKIYLL